MTGAACAAAAVTAAGSRVIADLSALEYIDCCALGALLRARGLARLAGGDVLLAAPQGLVLRVLDLAGVTGMPGVFASVAAAAGTGRCVGSRPAAVAPSGLSWLPRFRLVLPGGRGAVVGRRGALHHRGRVPPGLGILGR